MRWLVAVVVLLTLFGVCLASLALLHVWDTGTQVAAAVGLMTVVLPVLVWWVPLGREKIQEERMQRQEERMQRQHAELVTIEKKVDIRQSEIVALLRNDGLYRITDVVIEAAIDRDSSEIATEIEATEPWVDVQVKVDPGKVPVGEVPPLRATDNACRVKLTSYHSYELDELKRSHPGGPWAFIAVNWSGRLKPYSPGCLTEERARKWYSISISSHKINEYLDQHDITIDDRLRARYHFIHGEDGTSKPAPLAIYSGDVNLCVVFTDVAGRRWRRSEDRSLVEVSP